MALKLPLKSLFLSGLVISAVPVMTQSYLGITHSNLGGVHTIYMNPANIADTRYRTHFNLIAPGFNFNNTYLTYNVPFSLISMVTGRVPDQYKDNNGKINWEESWLKENLNGKPKDMNLFTEFRGPSVMVKLNKSWSVALASRMKMSIQVNNVAEPLARIARYGLDSSNGNVIFNPPSQIQLGQTYGDNAFTINVNAYSEFSGSVAKVLMHTDNMLLKAGVTGKYLVGIATGYIKNDGIQVKVLNNDSVVFGQSSFEYGYVDPGTFKNINNPFDLLKNANGKGLGWDIGGTFEYSPDATSGVTSKKNQYLFRGGISIMDIGNVRYNKNIKNTSVRNDHEQSWKVTDAFSQAWQDGVDVGLRYTDSVARSMFMVDTSRREIKTVLPTHLNMQFDYNLFKMFYIGANIVQSLRTKKAVGMRRQSSVTLIPRMETKWAEFAIPLALTNDYKSFRLGVYLRLGPIFVGSDNLIGTMKSANYNGMDFYFGISQGIGSRKKKKNEN